MVQRKFKIAIAGRQGNFFDDWDEGVLRAMERAGRAGIPVGCRNGGCGSCKVLVLKGQYRVGKMSRQHLTVAEERAGYALACQLYPESDIEVRPTGSLTCRTTD